MGVASPVIRTNFQRMSSSIRCSEESGYLANGATITKRTVSTGAFNTYFMYRLPNSQQYTQSCRLSLLQLLMLTRQLGCKDDLDWEMRPPRFADC